MILEWYKCVVVSWGRILPKNLLLMFIKPWSRFLNFQKLIFFKFSSESNESRPFSRLRRKTSSRAVIQHLTVMPFTRRPQLANSFSLPRIVDQQAKTNCHRRTCDVTMTFIFMSLFTLAVNYTGKDFEFYYVLDCTFLIQALRSV